MNPLYVEVLDKERAWEGTFRLTQDFTFDDPIRGPITVPAGFVTDFATVPFPARWVIPQAGRSAKPSVLHDWMLHRSGNPRWATGIFNRALKADGTPAWRRVIMVAFVAAFTFPDLYL